MFAVLISIILSVESKIMKSNSKKFSSFRRFSKSNVNFLAVDSVECYDDYTAVLTALEALKEDSTLTAPLTQALTKFEASCAKTLEKKACDDAVTALGTAQNDKEVTDFSTSCTIQQPTEDSDGCYDSYDTLIKALEKLNPNLNIKIRTKDNPITEFNEFVTNCAKTSHGKDCKPILAAIKPEIGPVYANLVDIQGKCSVTASNELSTESAVEQDSEPSKQPQGDIGFTTLSLNNKIIWFILALVQFYFIF
jgi:hypothetical protein